jgi:predicted metal-dependent hydrolase
VLLADTFVRIYHVRKLLVWWYDQRQKKEEATLATLRKEQKDKLEDLKKKTSYYTTQSLLEKYDDALLKKKKEEALKQQQQQQQQQQQPRKPVSMPMRQQQPNFPANFNNGAPRPMQPNQQPILPPPRTEPQWYDKLVDALVGDAGPETKYALICTHCYNHNGLVAKEEFDTIRKYSACGYY